jgi:cytochrome c peroxidase
MISGPCADIGKLLRGLVTRTPHFHTGSAPSLPDAVKFYHPRFAIGFAAQHKHDPVASSARRDGRRAASGRRCASRVTAASSSGRD